MKYKLLLLFMLVAGVCWGQGVYKYKGLEVTATCKQGPVTIEPDSDMFHYKDSIVSIGIQMNERSVCNISVKNLYSRPILVKWRRVSASNDDTDFYSNVASQLMDVNRNTGEDKLYKGELRSYILRNWTDDMFSKKKKNQKGYANVSIVVNDELREYHFLLTANPIEK